MNPRNTASVQFCAKHNPISFTAWIPFGMSITTYASPSSIFSAMPLRIAKREVEEIWPEIVTYIPGHIGNPCTRRQPANDIAVGRKNAYAGWFSELMGRMWEWSVSSLFGSLFDNHFIQVYIGDYIVRTIKSEGSVASLTTDFKNYKAKEDGG